MIAFVLTLIFATSGFGGGGGIGTPNTIDISSDWGFIGGGQSNTISANYQHSFIGGGLNNTINGNCSGIVGGLTNTVSSDYSFIIGNRNTIPAALPNTHIVGSGINAVSPNTLHVNGLWANGIPSSVFGPFPAGTLFSNPAGAPLPFLPLPSTQLLWIM